MAEREPTDHPTTPAENVCVRLMDMAEEAAQAEGRKLSKAVVLVELESLGPGDPNGGMHGHGDFEDGMIDVLVFVLHHAKVLAEAMGLDMQLMSLDEPKGQG